MRRIQKIYANNQTHWVGNGFRVTPLFSHMGEKRQASPFLMFDYAAPHEFAANFSAPRGVGEHPHRGFETVTIAYHGEVAHRDGSGAEGVIGAGDVQWMTAGNGTVHEEFHSEAFSKTGGTFEMAQIWVNLPKQFKNVPPRYQHLSKAQIPVVHLSDASGSLRIIGGQFGDVQGAAQTYSELNLWDIFVNPYAQMRLRLPEDHNVSLAVRVGKVLINQTQIAQHKDLVVFERESGEIVLHNQTDEIAELILLSGVPIDEPIAAYGPFVMNTPEEIRESIELFKRGELGSLH
ncbi:MAG: pirin family protein [Alysiella sp.]|uniref:pirin family protein n=1 Tax=Alysiella sp. TaxID=1872483 RepID=UPI0026DD5898|nr:pirin family protein [Alysiella sp.]MDO4434522.1 pirin family protein [Alysiella sp.]